MRDEKTAHRGHHYCKVTKIYTNVHDLTKINHPIAFLLTIGMPGVKAK